MKPIQPKITISSEFDIPQPIMQHSRSQDLVYDRLYKDAQIRSTYTQFQLQNKKVALNRKLSDSQLQQAPYKIDQNRLSMILNQGKECQAKPKINSNSRRLAEHMMLEAARARKGDISCSESIIAPPLQLMGTIFKVLKSELDDHVPEVFFDLSEHIKQPTQPQTLSPVKKINFAGVEESPRNKLNVPNTPSRNMKQPDKPSLKKAFSEQSQQVKDQANTQNDKSKKTRIRSNKVSSPKFELPQTVAQSTVTYSLKSSISQRDQAQIIQQDQGQPFKKSLFKAKQKFIGQKYVQHPLKSKLIQTTPTLKIQQQSPPNKIQPKYAEKYKVKSQHKSNNQDSTMLSIRPQSATPTLNFQLSDSMRVPPPNPTVTPKSYKNRTFGKSTFNLLLNEQRTKRFYSSLSPSYKQFSYKTGYNESQLISKSKVVIQLADGEIEGVKVRENTSPISKKKNNQIIKLSIISYIFINQNVNSWNNF